MSKETDALLHHPDVTKVIRAILMSTGLRQHLLDEGIQQVYADAWADNERHRRSGTSDRRETRTTTRRT
jgi:hypothetical protein